MKSVAVLSIAVAVISIGASCLWVGCDSERDTGVDSSGDRQVIVSKDSLTVLFLPHVTAQEVEQTASRYNLRIIKKHYGPDNTYQMMIDRAIVPDSITATDLAQKLMKENRALIDTAYAVISGPGLE